MTIVRPKFVKTKLDEDITENEQKNKPISVKLNDKDREMIAIGKYALNMHSDSGVLKELAEMGLKKVILGELGLEKWHKLTRGDRIRLVYDKPKLYHFYEKVIEK